MSETEVVCIVNSCKFCCLWLCQIVLYQEGCSWLFVSMCSWKNGSCRDGVKVLKCHSYLVWLLSYMNLCRLYCLMWFCNSAVVMQVFWWFHIARSCCTHLASCAWSSDNWKTPKCWNGNRNGNQNGNANRNGNGNVMVCSLQCNHTFE